MQEEILGEKDNPYDDRVDVSIEIDRPDRPIASSSDVSSPI